MTVLEDIYTEKDLKAIYGGNGSFDYIVVKGYKRKTWNWIKVPRTAHSG